MTTLLPPNASPLERALENATAARQERIEVPVDALWSPARCPAPMLPWLAWAFSVDVWNGQWPEAVKRAVIAESYEVHRRKGTRGAMRRALASLRLDSLEIAEWWETTPQSRPGTFAVTVASGAAVTPELHSWILATILAVKNVRSHLASLRVILQQKSIAPRVAALALIGETATLYPWMRAEIVVQSAVPRVAAAVLGNETVTLYPWMRAEIVAQSAVSRVASALYGTEIGVVYPGSSIK